jgi:hypothetical protein
MGVQTPTQYEVFHWCPFIIAVKTFSQYLLPQICIEIDIKYIPLA